MTVSQYVVGFSQENTTSADWVNVVDGGLANFTSKAGCVIATFSASAVSDVYMQVQILLDGSTQ
jgi:hypothetical protein